MKTTTEKTTKPARISRKEQEKQQAIASLLETVKPGDTLHTVLRHVSKSGMMRRIDVYKMGAEPRYLTGLVASVCGYSFPSKGEGLKVTGCGMDMGFAIIYDLGWALFGKGWECTGENCPHNSHNNDRNAPRGKGVMHTGGYALRQSWL